MVFSLPPPANLLLRLSSEKVSLFSAFLREILRSLPAIITEALSVTFMHRYPYTAVVLNFSQSWALYCLVQFYTVTKDELAHIKPLAKFLTFKSIVFLTWWQGVAIALLCTFGLFKSPIAEGLQFKLSVQDFIICIDLTVVRKHFVQPLTMTNSVPGPPPWSRMPGEHGLGDEFSLLIIAWVGMKDWAQLEENPFLHYLWAVATQFGEGGVGGEEGRGEEVERGLVVGVAEADFADFEEVALFRWEEERGGLAAEKLFPVGGVRRSGGEERRT
ncbi:uncharacterized protein LOC106760366 [Vigna radiata var. radiata]|uniref:Uncharacterized protein LOC106760366 n=1 Tax=Vigna radiata var. radiata TaxID=3916 RepID=A0A1S3TZU2_VIGRR|nr:uncharacterized protein LOC106760366 [Vigna radiata var. radiata]